MTGQRMKMRTAERREFAVKLTNLHVEAVELGLLITSRALHRAVQSLGWELAGNTTMAVNSEGKHGKDI